VISRQTGAVSTFGGEFGAPQTTSGNLGTYRFGRVLSMIYDAADRLVVVDDVPDPIRDGVPVSGKIFLRRIDVASSRVDVLASFDRTTLIDGLLVAGGQDVFLIRSGSILKIAAEGLLPVTGSPLLRPTAWANGRLVGLAGDVGNEGSVAALRADGSIETVYSFRVPTDTQSTQRVDVRNGARPGEVVLTQCLVDRNLKESCEFGVVSIPGGEYTRVAGDLQRSATDRAFVAATADGPALETNVAGTFSGGFTGVDRAGVLIVGNMYDPRNMRLRDVGGPRPQGAGTVYELQVAGRGGVPADASAAVLNVTANDAASAGFATVWPCGSGRPNASSLNFAEGATIPNAVITKLGAGGKVCFFTSATTHLIVDVNGFFPAGSSYAPLNPERLHDSRQPNGL
jgi:hypothetical protein